MFSPRSLGLFFLSAALCPYGTVGLPRIVEAKPSTAIHTQKEKAQAVPRARSVSYRGRAVPVAPFALNFSLPNLSQPRSPLWYSQEVLGESALAVLLIGDASPKPTQLFAVLRRNLLLTLAAEAPRLQATQIQPVIVASYAALLQKGGMPSSLPRLWDAKNALRRQISLQEQYGIAPDQSALLFIDRAGWLRSVTRITSTGQLRTALRAISTPAHDPTPALALNQPAPDFVLPDMNGVLRRPAELTGKKYLLLTFFPKCFTGTCASALCDA